MGRCSLDYSGHKYQQNYKAKCAIQRIAVSLLLETSIKNII
jgi:hypothetical protein